MLVYYACLFICFLTKIESTYGQFKEHIDLQKIAEIMFQNEKYNVLKPTIHIVKDHFVEFIQKRDNGEPSERMFLDRNGFRHSWKGLELPRQRSFRKADIPQKAIDDKNDRENSLTINASARVKNNITIKRINTKTKRKQPRRATKKSTDVVLVPHPIKKSLRNDNATVIKTTLFCPFFGILKMTTRVENFEKIGNITRR